MKWGACRDTRMAKATLLAIVAYGVPAIAQSRAIPKFEDYPESEIFTSAAANPRLITAEERSYRTRIREGASKGAGVLRDGIEQQGPNFAGHYIAIVWGPCEMMAIVDAKTGQIYYAPLSENNRDDERMMLPILIFSIAERTSAWRAAPLRNRLSVRLPTDDRKGLPQPCQGMG